MFDPFVYKIKEKMRVNKNFFTSSNFDGLFMCTFTDDSSITFFMLNPLRLGSKQ